MTELVGRIKDIAGNAIDTAGNVIDVLRTQVPFTIEQSLANLQAITADARNTIGYIGYYIAADTLPRISSLVETSKRTLVWAQWFLILFIAALIAFIVYVIYYIISDWWWKTKINSDREQQRHQSCINHGYSESFSQNLNSGHS